MGSFDMSHLIDQLDNSRTKPLQMEHDGQMSSGRLKSDVRPENWERQARRILPHSLIASQRGPLTLLRLSSPAKKMPWTMRRSPKRAQACFGRIDILVNNVGGTIWTKPFVQYEEAQIEADPPLALPDDLVLPGRAAGDAGGGGGVIVNVSSVATRGVNRVPCAAGKGGVNAITACLTFEYAEHGIRACGVAPGATEAPPRRIPRNADPPTEQENTCPWQAATSAER
jgi:NAD(P)-dependent dehydrogenase (short-subunit alcohol dehydrogenase family)